eukprot:241222_1
MNISGLVLQNNYVNGLIGFFLNRKLLFTLVNNRRMSKIKVRLLSKEVIFSRTSNQFYMCFILLAVCCTILFYSFALTPDQETDQFIATNRDSLPINTTSQLINDETQIIKSIALTKTCKPAYLMLYLNFGMHLKFDEYGFNLNCNRKEKKQLGICTKKTKKMGFRDCACKKYNHSNQVDSPLCNGGKLIWQGNRFTRSINKRFTVKTHLNRILTAYCNKYHPDDNGCNFHLLSFDMSISKERREFLTKHIDCNNDKPQYDQTWLFKEQKHLGTGIHIYNIHQLIYRLIVNSSTESIKNCVFNPIKDEEYFIREGFKYESINEGYVVDRNGLLMQTFIANPLLIELKEIKHVFHLRSFFLIPSYTAPFIVLYWPKFRIYVNPYEYNNKEKMQRKAMITNRHINDTYEFADENYEWMWGAGDLQRYLDAVYGVTLFGGNYTTNKLNSDLMYILKEVFHANSYYKDNFDDMDMDMDMNEKLNDNGNELYFDEGCMDIYINDKFELKLLEVNKFCGYMCDKPNIKRKIKQGGIYDWECDAWRDEETQIVFEMFAKKSNHEIIDEIKSLNQFKIAVWEK